MPLSPATGTARRPICVRPLPPAQPGRSFAPISRERLGWIAGLTGTARTVPHPEDPARAIRRHRRTARSCRWAILTVRTGGSDALCRAIQVIADRDSGRLPQHANRSTRARRMGCRTAFDDSAGFPRWDGTTAGTRRIPGSWPLHTEPDSAHGVQREPDRPRVRYGTVKVPPTTGRASEEIRRPPRPGSATDHTTGPRPSRRGEALAECPGAKPSRRGVGVAPSQDTAKRERPMLHEHGPSIRVAPTGFEPALPP